LRYREKNFRFLCRKSPIEQRGFGGVFMQDFRQQLTLLNHHIFILADKGFNCALSIEVFFYILIVIQRVAALFV